MTILQAMEDGELFGPYFGDGTWKAWRAFLAALFGLGFDDEALDIFRRHTGRADAPTQAFREAWLIVGRRGGKSRISALIGVFLATFVDWRPYLAKGEQGTIALIAADRKQARTLMRYIKALLEDVPMLSGLVVNSTAEAIELENGISIEVHTASFRSTRGYTLLAAIGDEVAFWRDSEGSENAQEVIRALRPGLATTGGLLLCISSPYARRGVLWNVHQKHFGKDSSTLVWQAPSREMNPALPQKVVDEAYAEDPSSAAAEYGAEFRKDVETFIDADVIANLVAKGRRELPPAEDVHYVGFVDPAGGSGQDSMTLAIAHREGERAILDCLREVKPPFSPEATTEQFAEDLKRYRLGRVIGDRFAGEWPRERFRGCGIQYDLAQQTRSQIYQALLPALNSANVELLENEKLTRQLVDLERRTGWGGRESIDHGPGKHDDVINAAAGALVEATRWRPSWGVS